MLEFNDDYQCLFSCCSKHTVNYVMLFYVPCTSWLISCADDVIMVFPVHHTFPEQNTWNTGM